MAISYQRKRVFGNTLVLGTLSAGETYKWDSASPESASTYFMVKGKIEIVNEITKEKHDTGLVPGTFMRHYQTPPGLYTGTAIEDVELWCYHPPNNNNNTMAPFDKLELAQDQTTTFEIGTKMFLCRGTLNIEGKDFVGSAQIAFTTASKTVTAKEHSYILIFQ